tara:strand:+ start:412 stop:675 length:264 start_codon:yes stop_codon:yes gene_type:complete
MKEKDQRSYTITKQNNDWYRVEVIDKYGAWTEVFEKSIFDASKFVYEYWSSADKRRKENELMVETITSCIELDEKYGLLKGNRDCLD